MKYLFLETIFNSPHLETSAEIALDFKSKNKKFIFPGLVMTCHGQIGYCQKKKKFLGASIKKN